MDISNVLGNIGLFMRYFAPGFIFISCMDYVRLQKREQDTAYLAAKCISVSFILTTLSETCLGTDAACAFWLLVLSVISGVLVGLLFKCQPFQKYTEKHFQQNSNQSLFVEMLRSGQSKIGLRIKVKDDPYDYYGTLKKVINPYDKPILIISRYSIIDPRQGQGKIIFDNRDNKSMFIVIDFSNVEHFEFITKEA